MLFRRGGTLKLQTLEVTEIGSCQDRTPVPLSLEAKASDGVLRVYNSLRGGEPHRCGCLLEHRG